VVPKDCDWGILKAGIPPVLGISGWEVPGIAEEVSVLEKDLEEDGSILIFPDLNCMQYTKQTENFTH